MTSQRVLLMRWNWIGDIILAYPAAATIKESNPDAELAWFVDTRFRELVDGHKRVDKVFTFDRKRFKGREWNPFLWRALIREYLKARSFRPDVVINLQPSDRIAFAAWLSKGGKLVTLDPKRPIVRFLAGQSVYSQPNQHAVEANLEAVSAAGFTKRTYEFAIPIREEHRRFVDENFGHGGWITVHLGTRNIRKQWPPERFAQVAERLAAEGFRIVLVGGPGEEELRNRFLKIAHAEDWVGKTNLMQLSEIIRRSKIHLSNDTASAHIAAVFEVPCVTVFGYMSPAVFHPYLQPDAVIDSGGDILGVSVETVLERCLDRIGAKVTARK